MNNDTHTQSPSLEELQARLKAARDVELKASNDFRAKLFNFASTHLSGPTSSHTYLFAQCLRIAFERDRHEVQDHRRSNPDDENWEYADWDVVTECAEDLFEEALVSLSNFFQSPESDLCPSFSAKNEAKDDRLDINRKIYRQREHQRRIQELNANISRSTVQG